MTAPEEIISEAEILRVHAFANFGPMTPREVVNDGVHKYAIGYTGGATQVSILREHGLITAPKNSSYRADLTQKGKAYARSINLYDLQPRTASIPDKGPEPDMQALRLVTVAQLERLLHSLGELDGETMLDEEIRNSLINELRSIIGENGNG